MLSPSERMLVRKTQTTARTLLEQSLPIEQLDIFFNGAPGFGSTIKQEDIDATFPESGLTVQALADAIYAMKIAKQSLDNAKVALTILAELP